jgi:hypothetical protein
MAKICNKENQMFKMLRSCHSLTFWLLLTAAKVMRVKK